MFIFHQYYRDCTAHYPGCRARHRRRGRRERLDKRAVDQLTRRPFIEATQVRENWFSPALIVGASWQTGRRVSSGTFCRFFDGFGPAQGSWCTVAAEGSSAFGMN
jgi:hypothetical protein